MTKQAPDTVEARPVEVNGLAVMYEVQLVEGRKLSWESKLDATCEQSDMDELLDRVFAATERQKARSELRAAKDNVIKLKVRIELQEQQYAREEAKQMVRFGAGRKQGSFRRTEAQDAALGQIMTTIASLRADVPMAEWNVKRLEAIIAGEEPPEVPFDVLVRAMDEQPVAPRPTFATAAE